MESLTPLREGRLLWEPGAMRATWTLPTEAIPLVLLAVAEGGVSHATAPPQSFPTLAIARDSEYHYLLLQITPTAAPNEYEAVERVRW